MFESDDAELSDSSNEIEITEYEEPFFLDSLNLKPEILQGLHDMHIHSAKGVQNDSLRILLKEKSSKVLIQTDFNAGNTEIAVIAMLSQIDSKFDYPQALCICPSFKNCTEMGRFVCKIGKYLPELTVKYAVDGKQVNGNKLNGHIVIGTVDKVIDWTLAANYFNLKKIKIFVCEEAQIMNSNTVYKRNMLKVMQELPNSCQMVFFSINDDSEDLITMLELFFPKVSVIHSELNWIYFACKMSIILIVIIVLSLLYRFSEF